MKPLTKLLWVCVAIEMIVAAVFIVGWIGEPIPPRPDLTHCHPATTAQIREQQKQVFEEPSAHNWFALGKTYLLFGHFQEAEYCCRRAAEADPNQFLTFYWWGIALNQIGETSQAIERFRQALSLAENAASEADAAARCWYGIGRNHLRQQEVAKAEEAFRQAENYIPCRHQLARILVRSGRSDEAVRMLDDLTTQFPNHSTYYQLRARAKAQMGDDDGAFEDRAHSEHASEMLRSDDIIAELQLEAGTAGVYGELQKNYQLLPRDPSQAATNLRELLAAEWRSDIAGLLVEAELSIGNAQQAADLLKTIMQREGTSTQNLEQLANSHRWLNQHDLAFELRKRIVQIRHIENVHADLARDFEKRGEPDLAQKHRALSSMASGISKFRQGHISDARRELQAAVQLDSGLPNAWFYLAECLQADGSMKEATAAYRNCLNADADHGRARSRLSRLVGMNIDN